MQVAQQNSVIHSKTELVKLQEWSSNLRVLRKSNNTYTKQGKKQDSGNGNYIKKKKIINENWNSVLQ